MKQGWLQGCSVWVSDSKVIVSSPGTSRWFPGISGDCRERPWQAGGRWLRRMTAVGPGRGRNGPAGPCCLSRAPTLPLQNLPPLCHVVLRTARGTLRVRSKIYTCPPKKCTTVEGSYFVRKKFASSAQKYYYSCLYSDFQILVREPEQIVGSSYGPAARGRGKKPFVSGERKAGPGQEVGGSLVNSAQQGTP